MEIQCSFDRRRVRTEENPLIAHNEALGRSYGFCNFDTVLGAIELEEGNYGIDVVFMTSENHGMQNIDGFEIKIDKMNPDYILYNMIMRYFLCIVSFFCLMKFWKKLRQIPQEYWCYEQNYLRLLGIGIILYNDPLSIMNVMFPNLFTYLFIHPKPHKIVHFYTVYSNKSTLFSSSTSS